MSAKCQKRTWTKVADCCSYRRCRSRVNGGGRASTGSHARLRFCPEHARLVDALHELGAVLVADIPELVPFNEALGRPARVFAEYLLPLLPRLLLAAELT